MNEQQENIQRVQAQIAGHVTTFINAHLGQEFHVEQLRQFCYERLDGYIAPGSPDRILRALRQKKEIDYVVVNRRQSLYRAVPVDRQRDLFSI